MGYECGPKGWPGDVDSPNDPGGATRAGIAQKFYDPTGAKSVYDLTQDQVVAIYKSQYWDAISGDSFVSSQLAFILLDTAVNQGVTYAKKCLQFVLGLPQDGVIGPQTLGAANSKSSYKLLEDILWARANRYVATCRLWQQQGRSNPWSNLSGWISRLNWVRSNL